MTDQVLIVKEDRSHKPTRYHEPDAWSVVYGTWLTTRCGVYEGKGGSVGELELVTPEEAEARDRLPCARCFDTAE